MLPIPTQHYTQCSAAFPRLLRMASHPHLQGLDPASPASSDFSQDYPPLSGPAHQTPGGTQDGSWAMTGTSPPPKAQRLSHSRDPSASRQQSASIPSYAHKAGTPVSLPAGACTAGPTQQPQAVIWSNPWDSPATGAQPLSEAGVLSPCTPPPGPSPPPHQHYGPTRGPPLPPQWHTYLQAIPTKEDFRQLI